MIYNGQIVCLIAGNYTIYDSKEKKYISSKPRGVFRIKDNAPKVGDFVDYSLTENEMGIIEKIYPRKNNLIRPSICNIDQAFIIFSVKEPDLNLNLLDKFLVTLEYHQIKPIIIFNKMDLLESKEIEEVNNIISYYQQIGYHTIKTSAISKVIDNLKEMLTNKVSVFAGQSGVGKSSLLNVLNHHQELKTTEISHALGRGKHTTRHVELFSVNGGFVADTPGFGTIDFEDMRDIDIAQNFVDFFKVSNLCKYNGCLHLNEPQCMVKKEVENKNILASRYENYLAFIKEIRKDRKDDNSSFNTKYRQRKSYK